MQTSQKELGIVLPTYNMASYLALSLESLRRQTLSASRYEIVVVDHGSSDDVPQVLARYPDLPIHYLRIERDRHSVALPKNAGIRACSAEIVVTSDSGIIFPAYFLEAHLEAHTRQPERPCVAVGLCHGENQTDTDWLAGFSLENLEPWTAEVIADPAIRDPRTSLGELGADGWVYCWGGNLSARKSTWERVGLFDAGLTGWGNEDLELGLRFLKHGYPLQLEKRAWCFHYPHPKQSFAQRIPAAYKNWRLLMERHPEIPLAQVSGGKIPTELHYYVRAYLDDLAAQFRPGYGSDTILQVLRAIECDPRRAVFITGATPIDAPGVAAVSVSDLVVERPDADDMAMDEHPVLAFTLPDALRERRPAVVVITDIWKYLGGRLHPTWGTILAELTRSLEPIAQQIYYLDLYQIDTTVGYRDEFVTTPPMPENIVRLMGS